jgi:hypothetical protein
MRKWRRRAQPSRQQLIDRKHQLEGEIRSLAAEANRRRKRGEPVTDLERRLETTRQRHHETRLRIDRTGRED